MTQRCASCGELFIPARHFHRQCWTCWRRGQDEEVSRDAYAAGFMAGMRAAAGAPGAAALDAGLLRDAVVLSHPDRHPAGRAEQANRVTAYLLELLGQARQGDTGRAA